METKAGSLQQWVQSFLGVRFVEPEPLLLGGSSSNKLVLQDPVAVDLVQLREKTFLLISDRHKFSTQDCSTTNPGALVRLPREWVDSIFRSHPSIIFDLFAETTTSRATRSTEYNWRGQSGLTDLIEYYGDCLHEESLIQQRRQATCPPNVRFHAFDIRSIWEYQNSNLLLMFNLLGGLKDIYMQEKPANRHEFVRALSLQSPSGEQPQILNFTNPETLRALRVLQVRLTTDWVGADGLRRMTQEFEKFMAIHVVQPLLECRRWENEWAAKWVSRYWTRQFNEFVKYIQKEWSQFVVTVRTASSNTFSNLWEQNNADYEMLRQAIKLASAFDDLEIMLVDFAVSIRLFTTPVANCASATRKLQGDVSEGAKTALSQLNVTAPSKAIVIYAGALHIRNYLAFLAALCDSTALGAADIEACSKSIVSVPEYSHWSNRNYFESSRCMDMTPILQAAQERGIAWLQTPGSSSSIRRTVVVQYPERVDFTQWYRQSKSLLLFVDGGGGNRKNAPIIRCGKTSPGRLVLNPVTWTNGILAKAGGGVIDIVLEMKEFLDGSAGEGLQQFAQHFESCFTIEKLVERSMNPTVSKICDMKRVRFYTADWWNYDLPELRSLYQFVKDWQKQLYKTQNDADTFTLLHLLDDPQAFSKPLPKTLLGSAVRQPKAEQTFRAGMQLLQTKRQDWLEKDDSDPGSIFGFLSGIARSVVRREALKCRQWDDEFLARFVPEYWEQTKLEPLARQFERAVKNIWLYIQQHTGQPMEKDEPSDMDAYFLDFVQVLEQILDHMMHYAICIYLFSKPVQACDVYRKLDEGKSQQYRVWQARHLQTDPVRQVIMYVSAETSFVLRDFGKRLCLQTAFTAADSDKCAFTNLFLSSTRNKNQQFSKRCQDVTAIFRAAATNKSMEWILVSSDS